MLKSDYVPVVEKGVGGTGTDEGERGSATGSSGRKSQGSDEGPILSR
jgi:hypothetical protein